MLDGNLISEAYITLVEDKTEGDSYFSLKEFQVVSGKDLRIIYPKASELKYKFLIYKNVGNE